MQNGRRYNVNGFPRVCYVPNSPKGQKVRHSELLKLSNLVWTWSYACLPCCKTGEKLHLQWWPFLRSNILITWQYTRCTCLQCMPCMLLNDLWTDRWHVYITVSRRGTCFWDGWPCATKCEKDGKVFQEVREVSNTSPNVRIWLFLETAILFFTSHCSLVLIDLTTDFMV